MTETILLDVDGTLLDFKAAEKAAIRSLFKEFSFGACSDEMIARYSEINRRCWEKLERGEIEKSRMLEERFEIFFKEEGLDVSAAEKFNERYQVSLGDTVAYKDDSYDILKSLQGKYGQYAVSNGTIVAQTKKLKNSGLGDLFDGVFLSEELGAEKPCKEFFDRVFSVIGEDKKDKALIVGDSLSSDISGGINAGIKTCWYNPGGVKNNGEIKPDYEISDLHEIYKILRL